MKKNIYIDINNFSKKNMEKNIDINNLCPYNNKSQHNPRVGRFKLLQNLNTYGLGIGASRWAQDCHTIRMT
jgi:hypothetical protein